MANLQSLAKAFRQTLFFHFVLFTVTLGPLLFGYHLVSTSTFTIIDPADLLRPNSTPPPK